MPVPIHHVVDERAYDRFRRGDVTWPAAARLAIYTCCRNFKTFTTDEVWEELDRHGIRKPPERRAMGPAMTRAEEDEWCHQTGTYNPTTRPQAHQKPSTVWQSMLYDAKDPFFTDVSIPSSSGAEPPDDSGITSRDAPSGGQTPRGTGPNRVFPLFGG